MKSFRHYLAEADNLAPASNTDIEGNILDVLKATPEAEAFIEANTVRDADGDVDMAATLGQMMTHASKNMDVKGLQDAVAQMNVKLDNYKTDPDFIAATPEEQADFIKKLPEIRQTMTELVTALVKLQQVYTTGGQQLTDLSKTADYQKNNPMKGVKTFVPQPPPASVQEDNAILAMIRGIRA